MRAILVRIGSDLSFGKWQAPIDPITNDFVYVPIPESPGTAARTGYGRYGSELMQKLETFCQRYQLDYPSAIGIPTVFSNTLLHLDPDFDHLTYGDNGGKRGVGIKELTKDDLLVFYAALRPIKPCADKLIYALVGFYTVAEVVPVMSVPPDRWQENAHTRKANLWKDDIVVRAKRGCSGRLERAIPIGCYNNKAYRVRHEILDAWGGLSVKGGYIQRSAVPPMFNNPKRFLEWFHRQNIVFIERNN